MNLMGLQGGQYQPLSPEQITEKLKHLPDFAQRIIEEIDKNYLLLLADQEITINKENLDDTEVVLEEIHKAIDDFSKKLAKIKQTPKKSKEKSSHERKEKNPKECDKKFREIMFENAPNKQEDFIVAEKKTW